MPGLFVKSAEQLTTAKKKKVEVSASAVLFFRFFGFFSPRAAARCAHIHLPTFTSSRSRHTNEISAKPNQIKPNLATITDNTKKPTI